MNLQSKIAIVTGASSGIGTEFSKMLVESGSRVYGLARNTKKLENIKKELGSSFIPITLNITDYNAIENWVLSTFKNDDPDILVNNAGVGIFGDIDTFNVHEWHKMMDVNLSGVFYLTRLIVPLMKRNVNICHIANIASIAGLVGNPSISAYSATKFGLKGFSEALFKELRFDGIKVSCFFPGSVATAFFDEIEAIKIHENMMQPIDIAKTLKYVLETPDNFLINEITMRPLNPKPPQS